MVKTLTGNTTENLSQVNDTMGEGKKARQFSDIAKILMGGAHIPSVTEALHDTLRSFTCTRLHSEEGWYPFSFITEPHYKKAVERLENLYHKLESIPAEYRGTALEYAEEIDGMQGFKQEDAYMKGIIDGMEIQRLLQGTRERGEA